MSLTSQQKHYLKNNYKKQTPQELADTLQLKKQQVQAFLEKYLGRQQYMQLNSQTSPQYIAGVKALLKENQAILLMLGAAVFLVYVNSLGNGFVSDDIASIAENPSLGDISQIFSGSITGLFQKILYFILYSINGANPFLFRLSNIFFHAGSTITVFLLLRTLTNRTVALVSALLFAVHPLLSEAVVWISGGPYPAYSFFFLVSFLLYILAKNNPKYYAYSIASFILSLLSNDKSIVLFLVFPLYELALGNLKETWKKCIPYLGFTLVLLLLYALRIGYRIQAVDTSSYQTSSAGHNPFIQIPVAVVSYLGLVFWPMKLSIYQTELSFSGKGFAAIVVLFLIFLFSILLAWKKQKSIFFWLAFFIITLLPTLTPLGISWIVAERYVYLGSLGLFASLAVFIEKITANRTSAKKAMTACLAIVLLLLSVRTIVRNTDWKNEDTLWFATAKTSPSGQTIHNNLGDVYARQGNYEKSIEEFKRAIEINPNYADAYHNLGNTYSKINRFDEALPNFEKAISLNPSLWQSHTSIASIYFGKGHYDKAKEEILKALEIQPQNQSLQENLKLIDSKMR